MSEYLYNNYSLIQLNHDINRDHEYINHGEQTPSVQQAFGVVGMDNVVWADVTENNTIVHFAFTQYSLKQALKRFPVEAKNATVAEMQQLHDM
jgi:hypothetical protein